MKTLKLCMLFVGLVAAVTLGLKLPKPKGPQIIASGSMPGFAAPYSIPSQVKFNQNVTGSITRTLANKLGDFVSATDFAANGSSGAAVDLTGVLDSGLGIQAALNSGTKAVFMPCGTYKTATTISIPPTVALVGEGRPCTTISYTGSGWAVDFNDMQNGRIVDMTISLTSSALGGVRLRAQNTTAETRHVIQSITVTAVGRTVGQIGFLMSCESAIATLYHNRFLDIFANQMDIPVKFTSTVNNQGPNGNLVDGLGTQGQGTGLLITDGVDNEFTGMIFLGTSVANAISMNITVGGGFGVNGNTFKFISEQGVGSATTISIASGAGTTGGNKNNIFIGYANDATSITDNSTATGANANKYFLNTGVLLGRIQGSPPGSPLTLYGTSAGSILAGDGTAVPAALAGINIASAGSAFVTTSDGTVEGFIGNDSTTIYVGSVTNHPVAFRVSNSTKATLNTGGNFDWVGKFTTYNNIATAGYGVPVVHGTPVLLTAQTADKAATNVYAAAPVGEYRVCATARTTTSGTGTTANLNIIWTDEGGVKTDAVGTWALNSVTVTGQINKCEFIHAAAASNIQVSVTAGTYGTSVYALSATAERLN